MLLPHHDQSVNRCSVDKLNLNATQSFILLILMATLSAVSVFQLDNINI